MNDVKDDKKADLEAAQKASPTQALLFENRVVTLFGEINTESAQRTNERLLALAFASDDPITLYISSPEAMWNLAIPSTT